MSLLITSLEMKLKAEEKLYFFVVELRNLTFDSKWLRAGNMETLLLVLLNKFVSLTTTYQGGLCKAILSSFFQAHTQRL